MDSKIKDIWAKHTSLPMNSEVASAILAIYTEGRMDGALAVAQSIGQQVAQGQGGRPLTPRQEAQAADLALVAKRHPEVDLSKPVYIRGTAYKIVGFKAGAPKHAFLIEGPQGGRYKCPVATILQGQKS